jgi:uncharacterized protein YxjI
MQGPTQYRIRERAFSVGDDFWIETGSGERALKVDGKTFSERGTFALESATGEELYTIHEQERGARDAMEIERRGRRVATVRKTLAGFHHRYSLEVEDGASLSATGDFFKSEFGFEREGETVARVSNPWFQVRHTIAVEIEPGQDDALILAAIVCIDWMARG